MYSKKLEKVLSNLSVSELVVVLDCLKHKKNKMDLYTEWRNKLRIESAFEFPLRERKIKKQQRDEDPNRVVPRKLSKKDR